MAAIDHDPRGDLQLGQVVVHLGNADAVVVRTLMTATQHQVGIGVARGLDDCRMPLAVDAEVAMRVGGRAHGITGHGYTTIGAVLETDRHAQATGHLPVDLRLRGAGADGDPTEQVVEVAGRHGLQQFGCHR
ncbi:hypothetical protein D3C86_1896740 [compost metagenome]